MYFPLPVITDRSLRISDHIFYIVAFSGKDSIGSLYPAGRKHLSVREQQRYPKVGVSMKDNPWADRL